MTQQIHAISRSITPGAATLLIVFTAICFGLVPLFARGLLAEGLAPAAVAFYRYVFSLLIVLPFLPLRREKRREAVWAVGAGLIMGLGWVSYAVAIETAPVAVVGVIYLCYPLFTLFFARLMLRQRLGARAIVSGLLVLGAAVVALGPGVLEGGILGGGALSGGIDAAVLPALGMSFAAPLSFAFGIVVAFGIIRNLTTLERMSCLLLGAVIGLLPMLSNVPLDEIVPQSLNGWQLVVGMAVITAAIPQTLYNFAAQRVGPTRCAVAGSFELPTMLAVGWLAFGESIGFAEGLAAMMVILAILFTPSLPQRDPETSSAELQKEAVGLEPTAKGG